MSCNRCHWSLYQFIISLCFDPKVYKTFRLLEQNIGITTTLGCSHKKVVLVYTQQLVTTRVIILQYITQLQLYKYITTHVNARYKTVHQILLLINLNVFIYLMITSIHTIHTSWILTVNITGYTYSLQQCCDGKWFSLYLNSSVN